MTMKKARCFKRWAMAGCGLAAVGLLAVTGGTTPVTAADLGDDAYRADGDTSHYNRKSRGSGHTFDVEPYRHPQSIAPRRDRHDDLDRHAYRDDDNTNTYNNDTYRDVPSYGSLKDDIAPEVDEPRWGQHKRWRQRDYADRSVDRWSDRRPDEWNGSQRCIPKRRIRRQLRREGWRGFRRGRVRGNIGYMVARQRDTGEIYELAVDRCTGDVISASCIGNANRGIGRGRFRNRDYREDVVIRW